MRGIFVEKIWNDENPELEGMSQDDPILKEIIENEKWTADQIGETKWQAFARVWSHRTRKFLAVRGLNFPTLGTKEMKIPPTIDEALEWRDNISKSYPEIEEFVFVHGHLHIPREESKENVRILCQGATGLPFDEDPRSSIAFLTIGDEFKWDVVRFDYDSQKTIDLLESKHPSIKIFKILFVMAIRNDI